MDKLLENKLRTVKRMEELYGKILGVSLKMGWCFYTANSLRFRTSLPLWK